MRSLTRARSLERVISFSKAVARAEVVVYMRRAAVLIVLALLLHGAVGALATNTGTRAVAAGGTYYVSPSGSDSNPGTLAAPWRDVARVNQAVLQPGDRVLFAGGQRFTDTVLIPRTSGTSSAPITFGSYGTGRAIFDSSTGTDVWLPSGSHDFVFTGLELTGSGILFASAGSGSGVSNVTIDDSLFHDTPQAAINIATHADHDWTITGSTFRHTGDSAIIVWGSNVSLTHSVVTDTGWNPAITWGKHGIYDKGADTTIAYDDFSANAGGQAISLRSHGARIYRNAIHDTAYAVGFFDFDPAPAPQGTDYVYDNRLWNITGWAFYYSGQRDPQGNLPSVGFVLASNTFSLSKASEAVNVSEVPSIASVTLANNVFTGSFGSAYRGCATCTEYSNDWYGASSNIPNGPGDKHVAPDLSAPPTQAPTSSTSPVVDAGNVKVAGLSYVQSCDGGVLHYCGADPDQGGVEYESSGSGTVADTTPPTQPTELALAPTTSGGTLTWAPSTDASGVAGYRITVDGNAAGDTQKTSYALTSLACGTSHVFGVAAYDAAGNVSGAAKLTSDTAPCPTTTTTTGGGQSDTTPPSIGFVNLVTGNVVSSPSVVTVTASDPSGISAMTLSLDGTVVCSSSSSPLSCTVRARGWRTLSATATDGAGNTASADVRVHWK